MKHWKTTEIVQLFSGLNCSVGIGTPGGDYDTESLYLEVEGCADRLYVAGFRTGDLVTTPSDVDIQMVEVTDGLDSSGGLNSDEEAICLLYASVVFRLRRAGFAVVPNMREYF